MKKYKNKLILLLAALFIIFLPLSSEIAGFLVDKKWFSAVGYSEVFWTTLTSKGYVFITFFLIFLILLKINYRVAWRLSGQKTLNNVAGFQIPGEKFIHIIASLLILIFSFLAASAALPKWQTVLEFIYGEKFNIKDPIFNNDLSFYFFSVPFFESIKNWLFAFFILAAIMAALVYIITGAVQWVRGWKHGFSIPARMHLSVLLAGFTLVLSFGYWIEKYSLLYSASGVVYGAGYTDAHARVFSYNFMIFAALTAFCVVIISLFRKTFLLLISAAVLLFGSLLIIHWIYPAFQEKFVVGPNELEKEKPYIEHNIKYTKMAYNLSDIQTKKFSGTGELTRSDLIENKTTIDNIRLWDWRPLLNTYKQIQEIRLYYKFNDVDIDRYLINGEYRQVMVAARELAFEQVPEQAKTWVNQRLKYTHGYGIVMSPVNQVTEQGMPELFIKDIPPISEIDIKINRPEIYYGEETNHYIFTGTSTEEFDYPVGGSNKFTKYTGKGGVAIPSFFDRLLFAYHFRSMKILISEYFTENSKILYKRNILKRIKEIAPFLIYDQDPYLVISDGKLIWVIDAYTTGTKYPYAEPIPKSDINYIRNSVKVTIDAYHGDVIFYALDENDPVLKTYVKIFPTLFQRADKIPEDIKNHFRYPLDLFKVQAHMYAKYHMNDSGVFYNKEDLWRVPTEIYDSKEQEMQPYYVIMKLPEKQKEEFLLIQPFTPVNKNNMVAWMAAQSDKENYGKLIVYEFPKKELIYGPMQIEARIDQAPAISELLTLWSQKGSSVIRGNLMVIPIKDALLYIEPLYLKAEQGEMPELKRVIAAHGNKIVMKENLKLALEAIFGRPSSQDIVDDPGLEASLKSLIETANKLFNEGQKSLKQGDWNAYGAAQKQLQIMLEKLQDKAAKN
ncbi:MAG: UPF0182 family protein [Spirochaetia bacterium]|nr:UPF0182 family protein [Spirochaetia bacterium]